MNQRFILMGALLGAMAVLMGAFGAHALKDVLSTEQLRAYHTGVEYQFYHVFALLLCGIINQQNRRVLLNRAGYLFIAGIILFSGSLYCMTLFPSMQFIGFVTPIGGITFVAGWLLLGAVFWNRNNITL